MRPGERLHEILFAREEPTAEIGIEGIVAAKPDNPSVEAMRGWLATLEQGLARDDRSVIYGVLRDAVPDFRRRRGLSKGREIQIFRTVRRRGQPKAAVP